MESVFSGELQRGNAEACVQGGAFEFCLGSNLRVDSLCASRRVRVQLSRLDSTSRYESATSEICQCWESADPKDRAEDARFSSSIQACDLPLPSDIILAYNLASFALFVLFFLLRPFAVGAIRCGRETRTLLELCDELAISVPSSFAAS
ncbi:hypothetical protein U1Q18_022424 [Sarracenia purpurea var. burkii]